MKQKVTIDDVAKHCNVSKSSVSRYLNNGYVSAKNKETIKQAIEQLGFERDFFASKIKAKHTRILGIIVNDLTAQGNARILDGMQERLSKLDYQGMILLSSGKQEQECYKELLAMGVDAVIFLDCKRPDVLSELVLNNQGKVLFAKYQCSFAPFLDVDEKRAGKMMGEYLKQKKLRSILYLQQDKEVGAKRLRGIEEAYGDTHYEMAIQNVANAQDAYEKMKGLIAKSYQLVLCENEAFALAVLKLCHELHIHVPQNLSCACFGEGVSDSFSFPSLTSLVYRYEAFGANLIEEMVAVNEGREPQWETIEYELIERDSVCEPKE